MRIIKHHPNSEFSLLWHRNGHGVKLIAGNLSDTEAMHRLEAMSELCGQPIFPDFIVNESADDGCGYYYINEDLPEGEDEK